MVAVCWLARKMLQGERDLAAECEREVNVGDNWRMYGVQKHRVSYKEGTEDLRAVGVYGCGKCHGSFPRKDYENLSDFYTKHYQMCGEVCYDYQDWGD